MIINKKERNKRKTQDKYKDEEMFKKLKRKL